MTDLQDQVNLSMQHLQKYFDVLIEIGLCAQTNNPQDPREKHEHVLLP